MLQVRRIAPFNEVLLLTATAHRDARGFHLESFNESAFYDVTGLKPDFVQDNHSHSVKGVLRGVHYQLPPHAQGKLIRVVRGAVFDVAVDLRQSSPTFGRWAGHELRDTESEMIWIPPGFGHGFLVLSDRTDVIYKTTDYYAPECEAAIAWNDPEIGIQWPEGFTEDHLKLSEKDRRAPYLRHAKVFD